MTDDPTDWRSIALRFADRGHRPEWCPADPPPWPGLTPSAPFRTWLALRLAELDALVRVDQREAIGAALTPETFASVAEALSDPKWAVMGGKLKAVSHSLRAGEPGDRDRALLNALKRLDEPSRRGRTRGEEPTQGRLAIDAAAWDIWKLRRAILPRFWPDDSADGFKLAKDELAKVAAARHGCNAQKVSRKYLDDRLANY